MKRFPGLMIGLAGAAMAATPGTLDPTFRPELRTPVLPDHVVIHGDTAWLSGGHERLNGVPASSLLTLDASGVSRQPLPGYLGAGAPFPLPGGGVLLPLGESGNWLRPGNAGWIAYPEVGPDEKLIPQFSSGNDIWWVRRHADGRRTIERRSAASGQVDPAFAPADDWPAEPLQAVARTGGGAWVLAGPEWQGLLSPQSETSAWIFPVDGAGEIAGPVREITGDRRVRLRAAAAGELRVELAPSGNRWAFSPAPESVVWTIEWVAAAGAVRRTQDFTVPSGGAFVWAESADGSYVVSAYNGGMDRYAADGVKDEAFADPGPVRHVAALPDGKWLLDGTRRMLADGRIDATWSVPVIDAPARNHLLLPLPGGRVMVGGDFRGGLAVYRSGGGRDAAFQPDPRIGEVLSGAVAGKWIYLATREPVDLRGGFSSSLIRVALDGRVDDHFTPARQLDASGMIQQDRTRIAGVTEVRALARGDLLVTSRGGREVVANRVHRLRADGSLAPGFGALVDYLPPQQTQPIPGGGFARGGVIHRADGSVQSDMQRTGVVLSPLCPWRGGVVFLEASGSSTGRLRWWKGGTWQGGFAPAPVDPYFVTAAAGENDTLYVWAGLGSARVALRRLLADGRIDAGYRSPQVAATTRREGSGWWTMGDHGRVDLAVPVVWPATPDLPTADLRSLLWHSASARLWVAGDFTEIDGHPRDGVARVLGGKRRVGRR